MVHFDLDLFLHSVVHFEIVRFDLDLFLHSDDHFESHLLGNGL